MLRMLQLLGPSFSKSCCEECVANWLDFAHPRAKEFFVDRQGQELREVPWVGPLDLLGDDWWETSFSNANKCHRSVITFPVWLTAKVDEEDNWFGRIDFLSWVFVDNLVCFAQMICYRKIVIRLETAQCRKWTFA